MADPLIGQKLGEYRITRLLKRTGMSMVYLARDDKLERNVVAKVMLPSQNDDGAFAARFHQEALATARLSHPNIIHIYDFGHCDDLYYMVMEYLPGGSLYDQEVREVESAGGSVGEMPAYQSQLETQVLNVPVKAHLLAVNTGETGIVVVGAASAASEPTYRPVLVAVLESFRVSGDPVSPSASLATRAAPTVAQAITQAARAPTLAPTFTVVPTRMPATATRSPIRPTVTASRMTPGCCTYVYLENGTLVGYILEFRISYSVVCVHRHKALSTHYVLRTTLFLRKTEGGPLSLAESSPLSFA